jgi:hypothetical protein
MWTIAQRATFIGAAWRGLALAPHTRLLSLSLWCSRRDCDKVVEGCVNSSDFLCLRSEGCLAFGAPARGCGLTTDKSRNEICKIGCLCCEHGLIVPDKLCAFAGQTLCCYSVGSLPFDNDYVPSPVCAYYFCNVVRNVDAASPLHPALSWKGFEACSRRRWIVEKQNWHSVDKQKVLIMLQVSRTATLKETKFADRCHYVAQPVFNVMVACLSPTGLRDHKTYHLWGR